MAALMHPFDAATQLTPAEGARAGTWLGRPSPAYANMVGPYGGISAAVALRAVLLHPALLGEPIALTVNFAAAITDAPFTITAEPVRTNRSTQHWRIELTQPEKQGKDGTDGKDGAGVMLTATAITATTRQTWSNTEAARPDVSAHGEAPRFISNAVEWTKRYRIHPLQGEIPREWDGGEHASLTVLRVRDEPPRPLDFASLAALSDVFFPRVWLRRATRVPAGTVSMTTFFHASTAELAAIGSGFLLGQARAQTFHNGFFDQTAQLWSEAGALVATSSQIVYYKE